MASPDHRPAGGAAITDQATYLPDRHMFALWTWSAQDSTAGQPPTLGERQKIRLVVPTSDPGQLRAAYVDCAVVEPDGLQDAPLPRPGASVAAWRARLEGRHEPLPVAAHAVPDATGLSLVTAEHAVGVFERTTVVVGELRGTVTAEMRPYQYRGVSWLRQSVGENGGAVLADEMGLGKTLQTIGYMVGQADEGPQLVVCPTSLVGNWAHEIARFAPHLRTVTWSGGPLMTAGERTIVLTGYTNMRTHASDLAAQHWISAVFDEAQMLKNPGTQASRSARAIPADAKIALTGTPVENRLDDLWAVLNLVAPQLFGHRTQFRRRFVRPIADGSADAAMRLQSLVEPVVMMRKKVYVAASLPPKLHTDLICDLTEEQQRLYDQVLEGVIEVGFGSGAQRKARVLATLTALKQVCNHPLLLDSSNGRTELEGRSGKLDLCTDVLANNLATDSPTLVFTQYRKTGELLVRHLAEQFGVSAPFFHGGLNAEQRSAIVRQFQGMDGPKLLVLSLKAAGTGLNLTRAADVIHFDRWWNPAVEAQASDRVHRIGQTRTVTITTLTTGGTVEEQIAAMHARKSALSVLADVFGVAGLAQLDDDHLIAALRRKRLS